MKPALLAWACFCGLVHGEEVLSFLASGWPWIMNPELRKGNHTQVCRIEEIPHLTMALEEVWGLWNTKLCKATWKLKAFLLPFTSCQLWETGVCAFPLSFLQKNMCLVFVWEKKNIHFSYFCEDMLVSEEEEVASFYEDCIGSSGVAHKEGVNRFTFERWLFMHCCSQLRESRGWLLQRSMPNVNASFFEIIFITFYS